MNKLRDAIRRFQAPAQPLSAGAYNFQTRPDAPQQYRLHLRLEPDGQGLLIVNASTVLHLNQTAAEYAYHMIKDAQAAEVGKSIAARYHIKAEQAEQDYRDFSERILTLIQTPDLDPTTFLDFERSDPYATPLSAPLRLDCSLTYQTTSGADPSVAPTERVRQELTTEDWQTILQKAWDAGIPHVIFTGGEPTLRPDLIQLIAFTQQVGQVTGLLSDGIKLTQPEYLHDLLQSGLDHLMLVLDPENEIAWKALEAVLPEDLFTTVHLTLTPENQANVETLLQRLSTMQVTSLSLSANQASLAAELHNARQLAAHYGLSLVWDLPVPYSAFHPVALEIGEQAPGGAGKAWLYVEPDGDVLPAQGVNQVLGNFLQDPWEKINREQA
jgi:organic radical activating enzyme